MKLTRYACSHCGKKFEAEEKDVLECPGCFWSTSVKKEEDIASPSFSFKPPPAKKKSFSFPLIPVLAIAAVFLVANLIFPFFAPLLKKDASSRKPAEAARISEESKGTEEKKKSLFPKLDFKKSAKKEPAEEAAKMPAPAEVSPADMNVLNRRIDLTADRPVSPEEQEILKKRASFTSGAVEKLPSQAWTLQDYKKMLAEQEKFFQVPLPGSYKRKLYDLFEKKYSAAAEAFKEGDLLQARNLWVESLAYPIYANNVQKHRGVILTMHRGIINDTLSKIGAINNALSEGKTRGKEQEITGLYTKLLGEIDRNAWPESYGTAVALQQKLDLFQKSAAGDSPIETYPQSVGQVDDNIRATLFDLLNVAPPSQADLEPIERDLLLKRKVIESFLPANLEPVRLQYQEALDLIGQSRWAEAEGKLKNIAFPVALYQDAQEKVKILRKLQQAAPAPAPGDKK